VTIHACTIIARNYLPAARVLARSFAEHHPGAPFTTLVIDDVDEAVDESAEPFAVLRLDDIGLEAGEPHRMAAIYEVMELSTAVKPWLLRTLLEGGADAAVYLDPDIYCYAPIDEVGRLARAHGIVLTPHVLEPMPRDGKTTSETSILLSGIYNLGFVAVSAAAKDFLEFWQERLRRECVVDPANMRFVDQRWVDFVPGMFDVHILRDPAYNVAYWNLHHRPLGFDGRRYTVGGAPLRFFHFSGYSPREPHLLSKHQGPRPRILLSEHAVLRRLCDEYGAALLAAGYEREIERPYGFARLANGLELDRAMRRAYRDGLVAAERDGVEAPPDPFDALDADAFLEWLKAVPSSPGAAAGQPRLSRYLAAAWALRPDLQAAFPEPEGADFDRVVAWSRHEAAMGRLSYHFVLDDDAGNERPAVTAGERAGEPAQLRPGIRIAGYLRAETGTGEHGRLTVAAVERAGIPYATHVDTTPLSRQEHAFAGRDEDDLDVNLVCVNADELPNFARRVGPEFFRGRYTIGLWAWELEVFPARFADSFDFVDEVWANSTFSAKAIAAAAPTPVFAYPLPIVAPQPSPAFDLAGLGVPDGPYFLFCFDLLSVVERKNPIGLIEAFSRAFSPGEGPNLVIKAVNRRHGLAALEAMRYAAGDRPDIVILDEHLDPGDNAALMAGCTCYVSLHRAEGFGLTMAEAMALGKPVIATAYSGNLDFMTAENSYLVDFTMGSVPRGCDPYPEGAPWAEPDLDDAARLMRQVVANPKEAAERGARARREVLERHGVDARARFVAARYAAARRALESGKPLAASTLPGSVVRPGSAPAGPPLIELARRRPNPGGASRLGALGRLVRRAVIRLLRHHDAPQEELNLALALAIEHLAPIVTRLEADLAELRAQVRSLGLRVERLEDGRSAPSGGAGR